MDRFLYTNSTSSFSFSFFSFPSIGYIYCPFLGYWESAEDLSCHYLKRISSTARGTDYSFSSCILKAFGIQVSSVAGKECISASREFRGEDESMSATNILLLFVKASSYLLTELILKSKGWKAAYVNHLKANVPV